MDAAKYREATNLFQCGSSRILAGKQQIDLLRYHTTELSKHLSMISQRDSAQFYDAMFVYNQYDELFLPGGKNSIKEQLSKAEYVERFSPRLEVPFFAINDAAGLVFAHAVLDSWVNDALRICALCSSSEWLPEIKEKVSFPMSAILETSKDDLLFSQIEQILKKKANESLPNRLELFMRRCPPVSTPYKDSFSLDLGRLKMIDKLRHKLVHGTGAVPRFETARDKVDYLFDIGFYLVFQLNQRYGLKVDPASFMAEIEKQIELKDEDLREMR